MKEGKEYEDFVYKIFSEYFKDFTLVQNDKIKGKQSGLLREIDVSIRGKVDDVELLYVIQAKDYKNHKADINTIGTFSSVIQDVGASKGFLICASGFAKTNATYARNLGIELLSVEDIESKKWTASIQIPVYYTEYVIGYSLNYSLPGNVFFEVLQRYKANSFMPEDQKIFSIDGGKNFLHINEHITNFLREGSVTLSHKAEMKFQNKIQVAKFPGFEFPSQSMVIEPTKKIYLKYVLPGEYRGIKDHLNNTFIPTTIKIDGLSFQLDSNYAQIDEAELPVTSAGFLINIQVVKIN